MPRSALCARALYSQAAHARREQIRALCSQAAHARREQIRARIRAIDEQTAAALPKVPHNGGSLRTAHSFDVLSALHETATTIELPVSPGEARCFVLQHSELPEARLAELRVFEPSPIGRFDAGLNGVGGVHATMHGARTHDSLPLQSASTLITYVLAAHQPGAVEAAASLPGLCNWVAAMDESERLELASMFGTSAADAAMQMATRSRRSDAQVAIRARTAWEHLATRYAGSAAAEEAALFRAGGAVDTGIAWGADLRPEGLVQSGGAMALLWWPDRQTDNRQTD